MPTTKVVPISGTDATQKIPNTKSKHKSGTKPSWLVRDIAKDGSPRYFVRLPFSEQQIGEPKYYGPFLTEASARRFEIRAYNLMFEAAMEVNGAANDIHAEEWHEQDEKGW